MRFLPRILGRAVFTGLVGATALGASFTGAPPALAQSAADKATARQLATEGIDIGFYEGDGLSLEETLREFILLSIPMQSLCKPDCAGLCPHCGANRNLTLCACEAKMEDPRWDALKKLI